MSTAEDSFVCAICDEFESSVSPDWFVTTKEGHVFHYNMCLRQWLNRGEKRCPLCNAEMDEQSLTRLFVIDPSQRLFDREVPAKEKTINSRKPDYQFKIIVLGDAGVGKSCLIKRFTEGSYSAHPTTVSIDMSSRIIELDRKIIKLKVWDTGGQERFKAISQNFARNAHGIIFMFGYDKTERQCITSIKDWMDFAQNCCDFGAAKLLVASKADKPVADRGITYRQSQALAENLKVEFFETSAKNGLNVDAVFSALAANVLENIEMGRLRHQDHDVHITNQVVLHESNDNRSNLHGVNQSKGSCC